MSHPDGSLDVVPVDSPPHATWVRWRVVALLLAFSFMSWFNRVCMRAAYDERIQKELKISPEAMGWVYSALLIAYMLFMTPGGLLADRIGPRRALAIMGFGSALFVALTGAVGFVTQTAGAAFVLFLIVRALMGVFTAPIYPASGRALMHWLPPWQRAGANGAVMGAALLGIACTSFGFGLLLDWFGWPIAFVITGSVTALLALVWTWYVTDWPWQHPGVNGAELRWIRSGDSLITPGSEPSSIPRTDVPAAQSKPEGEPHSVWGALLRNRSLMLLTLSYAAVGYVEYLFYFWVDYYFKEQLKLETTERRVFTTTVFLAMAAGMFLGGWVSDCLQRTWGRHRGRAAVVVVGMVGGAGFVELGMLATEPGWIVAWFSLALAAVGATEGPLWATALEMGGRHGATAAGIFNTGGNAGGVVAPVVTPLVSQNFGWGWGIGLGSLVSVAGATLWLWIDSGEGEGQRLG
jgi:ACS family D-galactonate transporter-like MFS transporter